MEIPQPHEQFSDNPIPVQGAFEIFEGTREELLTLTHNGRLLEVGDQLPAVPGIEPGDKPFIVHTVNAFDTPTCDSCVDTLEQFHLSHPDIPVYSLTKQTAEQLAEIDAKAERTITHDRITIDQETAVELGVALEPGDNADPEFWPTALRRTLAVVSADGTILDIQHPDDQEEVPDFLRAYEVIHSTS